MLCLLAALLRGVQLGDFAGNVPAETCQPRTQVQTLQLGQQCAPAQVGNAGIIAVLVDVSRVQALQKALSLCKVGVVCGRRTFAPTAPAPDGLPTHTKGQVLAQCH